MALTTTPCPHPLPWAGRRRIFKDHHGFWVVCSQIKPRGWGCFPAMTKRGSLHHHTPFGSFTRAVAAVSGGGW